MSTNNIWGQAVEINGKTAMEWLETGISEGFLAGSSLPASLEPNLFGRKTHLYQGADLASLTGMATSGLRTAAWMEGSDLLRNYGELTHAVRQHLAMVFLASSKGLDADGLDTAYGHQVYHALNGANCFQVFCRDVQEVVDWTLIAHRVAERALIPGLVMMDGFPTASVPEKTALPFANLVRQYLGDPDEWIASPTPAQELIFGKRRRRIPNWFHFDHPSLNGMRKDPTALADESAAQRRFFAAHLPEILQEAIQEYHRLSGRSVSLLPAYQVRDAHYLILTQGSAFASACAAVDALRKESKARVGCLNLSVWRPFPQAELLQSLNGVKGLSVLECVDASLTEQGPIYQEVLACLQRNGGGKTKLYAGLYAPSAGETAMRIAFENMMPKGSQKQKYYLGMAFSRSGSTFPKQEVLLQNLSRLYPGLAEETLYEAYDETPPQAGNDPPQPPLVVRQYRDQGPPYTRLSHFNDHTATFYRLDQRGESVADPFQALPVVPSATAPLSNLGRQRSELPEFQADLCTACGQCFTHCPHSALPPLSIGTEALIRESIAIATSLGYAVSALRPLVKNLARLASAEIRQSEKAISRAADFLPAAFSKLATKMAWDANKQTELRNALDLLMGVMADFPVAATDPLFNRQEMQEKGSGELFSMAIDPHACTACGLCVELCEENALKMVPQNTERLASLQNAFQLWEQLPDTPGSTITRLNHDPEYDPFAAILLSRNYYLSMTGGSQSESGAGAKALLHVITALTESIRQAQSLVQLRGLKGLIEKLSQFAESSNKPIEEATRQRQEELLQGLRDLSELLSRGPAGAGRARYGMLVLDEDSLHWASQFPHNVFSSPIALYGEGAAIEQAYGLLQGHLRHMLDNLKLMRRAALEVQGKYDPEVHDPAIALLDWKDLSEEEKAFVPPLLVVGSSTSLAEGPFAKLNRLLGSGWPVKVCLLENADYPAYETAAGQLLQKQAVLLTSMAMQNTYVLQSSMAEPRHLFFGLKEGLERPEPALFYLHCPEVSNYTAGLKAWKTAAEEALQTRLFCLLKFRPEGEGQSLVSQQLSLDSNLFPDSVWTSRELYYQEEGQGKTIVYEPSPADWARGQKAWVSDFQPWEASMGQALPVTDYLRLDPKNRTGKVGVVLSVDEEGALQRWSVSPRLVELARTASLRWTHLREVAGTLTPFPLKLRAEVEAELAAKYEQATLELREEFEEKRRKIEKTHMEKIQRQLRDKLLTLARKDDPANI